MRGRQCGNGSACLRLNQQLDQQLEARRLPLQSRKERIGVRSKTGGMRVPSDYLEATLCGLTSPSSSPLLFLPFQRERLQWAWSQLNLTQAANC